MSTGAIWWRVSGDEQLEVSPTTQVEACRAMAAEDGVNVPETYMLGTDFSSLEVWDSREMDALKHLIVGRSITHLYSYHSDRLPARPADRLKLMDLCKQYGVKVCWKHGPQPLQGEMAQLGDFLSAWQKEMQVLRAQQGAKDGLGTVARDMGRPTTFAKPLGYQWDAAKKGLKADAGYPIVQHVWQRALAGAKLHEIARELEFQGFESARGGQWSARTVANILHNPVYAGRYAALRYEAKAPQERRPDAKRRSGKTSSAKLPMDQWVFLESVVVDPPVVTWPQFLVVQERLEFNRGVALAMATAKHDYLLTGMLWCGDCRMNYYAHKGNRGYYYRCGSQRRNLPDKCANPGLEQGITERSVRTGLVRLLSDPELVREELERGEIVRTDAQGETLAELEDQRGARQKQLVKAKEAEVKHMMKQAKADDGVDAEIYQMAAARLKAERVWIAEELERIEGAISTIQNRELIITQIREIAAGIKNNLANAGFREWREILEDLQVKLVVRDGKIMLYANAEALVSGATVCTSPES